MRGVGRGRGEGRAGRRRELQVEKSKKGDRNMEWEAGSRETFGNE